MPTTTVDISGVQAALDSGVDAAKGLIESFGTKGVELALGVIGAGLIIFFIYWGFHKGKKALSGK